MVSKEQVEQLMLRYFRSCPLCGASEGYKVSGLFKNYVQCKSCEAKWLSNDFIACKELKVLRLWKPSRDGRGASLKNKDRDIKFWQEFNTAEKVTEERKEPRVRPLDEREKEIWELLGKLKNKDPKVRSKARSRLREVGQPVFSMIGDMAKSSNVDSRTEAMWLLGLMEDERSIDPLIEALKNDQSIAVRANACMSLGEMKGYPRVIDALAQALHDTEVMQFEKGSFLGIPKMGYITVRNVAIAVLKKNGDRRCIAALVSSGAEDLKNQDWRDREHAATFLGGLGEAQTIEPLTNALKDEHWKVRRAAAKALGEIGTVKAVGSLAQALNDESWDVRAKTVESLGKIRSPKAVEHIIQALRDEHTNVRQKAANILGDIGDARALEALTQAKEDKSWFVRQAAKVALKKIQAK